MPKNIRIKRSSMLFEVNASILTLIQINVANLNSQKKQKKNTHTKSISNVVVGVKVCIAQFHGQNNNFCSQNSTGDKYIQWKEKKLLIQHMHMNMGQY